MRIALFGKSFKPDFTEYIQHLFEMLKQKDTEVIIYEPFLQFIQNEINIAVQVKKTFSSPGEIDEEIDYMFSIGGDGTFLESVSFIKDRNIPIIGLNSGRLGFLANISREDITDCLEAIFKHEYKFEERSLIRFRSRVNLFEDFPYGLNEVAIQKQNSAMITIHTYIDDDYLNSYWADGLIISTPTGSTAYSLSVGGPIIMPCMNTFIISPIAAHNLSVRPLIVPHDKEIKLKIESRSNNFMATIDNRTKIYDCENEIRISLADFKIKMLKFSHNNFYNTLRNKLMWGLDKRN